MPGRHLAEAGRTGYDRRSVITSTRGRFMTQSIVHPSACACCGDMLRTRFDRRRFLQMTASEFSARLAEASSNQTIAEFQTSFQDLELFILEDLHALERRPESQRQLLSILDELHANGCGLVLTSRKPPGELADFSYRLVNRFHGAASALIKLPGRVSRESLLTHFANSRQVPLPAEVVSLLADAFPVSPRELLGLVLQLETAALSGQCRIDLPYVKNYLRGEVQPAQITLEEIAKSVARHFGIPLAKLRSRARVQGLVLPRQCAMFLARELTADNLEQIGHYFSNRDHSTVVHSCNRLLSLLPERPELRQHLTQIRSALGL